MSCLCCFCEDPRVHLPSLFNTSMVYCNKCNQPLHPNIQDAIRRAYKHGVSIGQRAKQEEIRSVLGCQS